MALKKIETIEILGEEREVYTRIEEETSQVKGRYNVRCRKYIIINDIPCEKSFDEFIVSNITVDLDLPIRTQLYEYLNADGLYENV